MTTTAEAAPPWRIPDVLLSWDRLGFRLAVFGGLALMWILDGVLAGRPWQDMLRAEIGGLLPWAFLAPIVLSLDRIIRREWPGRWRFLAGHLAGMVLVFVPYWLILRTVALTWNSAISGWSASQLGVLMPTTRNVLGTLLNIPFVYLLILLGAEGMRQARARQDEALTAERLALQLSEARLALLQRQLHPHFLFNALQAVSTLLHRDPTTADRLLVRLSSLLRAMLDDASAQALSLRQEFELTRKYLEIEQVRFGDRLSIEWRVDDSVLDVAVPSLVVLPLVENAIRHGLSPKVGPGHLTIEAQPDGSSLRLTVEDDGVGSTLPVAAGLGIGNSRERLRALYGDRATLEIDSSPLKGFRARLLVPMTREHA